MMIEANNERGKHMDNLIDGLEFRDTPQGLLGIVCETWSEIEGELENDQPCQCVDCRRMPC
jgi:hypothetical protein